MESLNYVETTETKKPKMPKRTKIIIAVISIVAVILIGVGIWCIVDNNSKSKDIDVYTETKTIEYGETYTPNITDFISSSLAFEYDIKGEIPNEEGKEYPAVGEYKLTISRGITTVEQGEQSKDVTLIVKDTTSPELIVPESIEVVQGTDLKTYDFKSLFEAKDLSEVKDYEIDTSKVDSNVPGEYIITVNVSDKYNNKTTKEIKCVIVAPAAENEETTTEIVTQEDGTKKVVVKRTEKPKTEESTTAPSGNNSSSGSGSSNKPSGGSSSNKPSGGNSSGSGSSSNKPSGGNSSSGGGSTTKPTEPPTKPQTCTNNNNHSIKCGNMGKWFNSRSDLIAYYNSVADYWNNKLEKGEITWDEYIKNSPDGYECWSCSYCGKWTGNFKNV